MQTSKTLAAAFGVAAFAALAGPPALASTPTDTGFTYRAAPPSSNPHDIFRNNIKVTTAKAKADVAMKTCGSSMPKTAASKLRHDG